MAMPMKLIPDLIENCFSYRSPNQDDTATADSELKLLAKLLRKGEYEAVHLKYARNLLLTPPNSEWDKDEWSLVCEEFDKAVDSLVNL